MVKEEKGCCKVYRILMWLLREIPLAMNRCSASCSSRLVVSHIFSLLHQRRLNQNLARQRKIALKMQNSLKKKKKKVAPKKLDLHFPSYVLDTTNQPVTEVRQQSG